MWQKTKNVYHYFVALLAAIWYGFPSRKLTVIGVTGTDGKSTTTNMIYEILKAVGKKVSMVSTVRAVVGKKTYDLGFHVTTPDAIGLGRFMKQAVTAGDEYFVVEISSHGLDQNRAAFIRFAIGVLTTLTHEHLDYHKTFAGYANAKFKLLRGAQEAVILPHGGIPEEVASYADFENTAKHVVWFGLTNGNETQTTWKFKLKIPGDYNILNALAAASVGEMLGIPKIAIKKALENFQGIAGRFEDVVIGRDFRVVIDFASTPHSLEQVLKTARLQVEEGRVIAVFGSASQRDLQKRPKMGEISGRLADITVLTDEDPRWEDSTKILDEIAEGGLKAGAVEGKSLFKIPDRAKAIEFVINKLARKGDIILLCGKGHEKSISIQGVETPWSEHEAVRKALSN